MRSSVVTSLICSSAQLYGALDWDLSSVFCRQPTLSLSLLTGWQIPLGHYISRLVERQKKKNPWRFNQLSGPVRLFYHPLWRYWFCSRLPQVLSGTVFLLFFGSSWEPTFQVLNKLIFMSKCSKVFKIRWTDNNGTGSMFVAKESTNIHQHNLQSVSGEETDRTTIRHS